MLTLVDNWTDIGISVSFLKKLLYFSCVLVGTNCNDLNTGEYIFMSNQNVDKQESNKASDLPNFMSENSRINYSEDMDNEASWLTNNLHKLMIWVSAIWFAVVLIYITQFFGWSNLFLMMPDEFGGFLAGVTLPLAIIWVVMAYIDRGSSFKHEAKFLRAYMNQLVYPEEGSATTAKAMADAIRSQVIELQEVTKLATEQTNKIKQELGGRVEDFAKLVGVLDNYSSKTMTELSEGVKTLVKSFDYVTERAESATGVFKEQIRDFSAEAINIKKDMGDLLNQVTPRIKEIQNTSEVLSTVVENSNAKIIRANEMLLEYGNKTGETVSQVSELLATQSNRLEQVASKAVKNCEDIFNRLDNGVADVEGTLRGQTKFIIDQIDSLGKQNDVLSKKFSEQGKIISVEVDKVLARANVIEESISNQVHELNGISDNILDNLNHVGESIDDKTASLENNSLSAISRIQDVVATLENQVSKLSKLADTSVDKTSTVANDIEEKQNYLRGMSENVIISLQKLNQELNDRTDNLRIQSDVSINQFNTVTEAMAKHRDNMLEASNIVVAQSKISETSLAQQQRHITGSINKIEETKAELKRQIEELTRAAAIIDSEAGSAIGRLKTQMDHALKSSEEVVIRTKDIGNNLQEQLTAFDDSTSNALVKVSQFEGIVSEQSDKLEKVSKVVTDRASTIANVLIEQSRVIDKSTANSTKTFNEILNSFETQSTLLNSVAENTVGYVSDVVQALDEKAEAINLLFKHQENEFFDICDRISENTNNIGGSLKKQVSVIEQSADRVFSRMALLEEDVSKRAENVVANTTKSIDKLAEIDKNVADQNAEINQFMQEITNKLNDVSNEFRTNLGTFSNIVKDVREESNTATLTLLNNCDKLKEANFNLSTETKGISALMDNHVKEIDSTIIKSQAQADTLRETFEHQKESLTDVANVVATQSRLGEASMAQQYKYLSDAASDVAQKMSEINAKFKENTDNVFETSTKIAFEFDVLGDRLIKVSDDIAKASKNSIKSVEQMNMTLNQCAEDLSLTVDNSSKKIGSVVGDYENHIARFNTVTAETSSGVIEISGMISEQSDKMIKISEDTKELVDCFNVVLMDTSKQLSNRANQAYDKVKGLGENLKLLSLQVEEAANMSSKHFEDSGDKLRATISEITANAERISNEIRSSGEVFLKQSGVLVAATDDTLQKVNNVMNVLNVATEEFTRKGGDIINKSGSFNELFNKQLKILIETSDKADTKLVDLEKRYEGIKVDTFLKDASYIIEKLETAAVDINRIFNPDAEEELWKKYYNGDTAAFVRHLSKTMTKNQVMAIRSEFEKNLEFRNLVTKYLSEFETLVTKARSNERSGILLSVISGADIGKLYYILARSLDKLN